MINILSIHCSLAFGPYLVESASEFLREGVTASRVVRQAGSGLIIRSDGEMVLRHQNRQASLLREEAAHYLATIEFRCEHYDVQRMQDEVVLANVGSELLLSYPQSDLWLSRGAVAALVRAFNSDSSSTADENRESLPEWLSVCKGGGRLLLSDQRTARWVLLGDDHICELERRLEVLAVSAAAPRLAPPTISLKGLTVHLQSAFKLAATLEDFADTGNVAPFDESTPIYSLAASPSTEGVELRDSDNRVALTGREARKWAGIIRAELERLNAKQVDRGGIRTVFANHEDGIWVLQWGDEILVPSGGLSRTRLASSLGPGAGIGSPEVKRTGGFVLLLHPETGGCVGLTDAEVVHLEGR